MLREQKTNKMGCPCQGMLEAESNKGVRSMAALEPATKNRVKLLEKSPKQRQSQCGLSPSQAKERRGGGRQNGGWRNAGMVEGKQRKIPFIAEKRKI
ncbi:hypothetical protein [Pectinatus brassicae]|uniref:hypothetical protein n=1 Tax=Pectinatus brassicae TaxID=862415 RepID=UPI001E44CB52|nr:hypothetical protein [Pectinatus brassicae]